MKSKALFTFWFVLLSVPLSYMMGTHSLSLNPSKTESLKNLATKDKWSKLHFLGADCGCSVRIFDNLMKRTPDTKISETVFVIGKNEQWIKNLSTRGYQVIHGEMDDFAKKYSINAVPQLTILDDKKNILYSGGYTTKRGPSSAIEDDLITKELLQKKQAEERPIFGCLNGTINRKNADPLKLKY